MSIYKCVICGDEEDRRSHKGQEPMCCGCVMDYVRPSERKKKNKGKEKPAMKAATSKMGRQYLVFKARVERMMRMGIVFKKGDSIKWVSGEDEVEFLILSDTEYQTIEKGNVPTNRVIEEVPLWDWYVEEARKQYEDEGTLEIDEDPDVSHSEEGAYVMAWVWVDNPEEEE